MGQTLVRAGVTSLFGDSASVGSYSTLVVHCRAVDGAYRPRWAVGVGEGGGRAMARAADEVVRRSRAAGHPPQIWTRNARCSGRCCCPPTPWPRSSSRSTPKDFYRSAHGNIYQPCGRCSPTANRWTSSRRSTRLRRAGSWTRWAGRSTCGTCRRGAHARGATHYAKIVADAALRRGWSRRRPTSWTAPTRAPTGRRIADGAERRIYDVARREDAEDAAVIGDSLNGRCRSWRRSRTGSRPDGAAHRVPRPRRPDLGAAARQPRDPRRPPGRRDSLTQDERRPGVAGTEESVALFSLEM